MRIGGLAEYYVCCEGPESVCNPEAVATAFVSNVISVREP